MYDLNSDKPFAPSTLGSAAMTARAPNSLDTAISRLDQSTDMLTRLHDQLDGLLGSSPRTINPPSPQVERDGTVAFALNKATYVRDLLEGALARLDNI